MVTKNQKTKAYNKMKERGKRLNMEENESVLNFEEVHDYEINDIWDIFFPNKAEKRETLQKMELAKKNKPRRYLQFLTM